MKEVTSANMIVVGLISTAGNFIWQVLSKEPDYEKAFERSFFQTLGLLILWLYI